MKPIIGLTCQKENFVGRSINRLNTTYINAVLKAGGTPIILPILKNPEDIKNYLDIVDGIIFTGGEDVSPLYFGEEPIREVDEICHDRDTFEMELFKQAYEKDIPIFGICRGTQLINIALGGTIYQDIYKQIPNIGGHTCPSNLQEGYHNINILNDTIIFDIFKKEKLAVNSLHHQAVKDLGSNLKTSSSSIDGIIESIESTDDRFILGVQFHPEAMAMKYEEYLKPFKYFIDRCKK